MDRERFRQVERLYHAALDREESQRPAFLEEACAGDHSLRREVESLLGHNAAASPLDSPAMDAAAKALAHDESHRRRTGQMEQQRIGSTVSHYRVLEKLGGGGMGVVYKAQDTKLGRFVALKFLPAHLAQDAAALERFEREARAASALNHPNICTVHEIDEYEGRPFIATELLQGETLSDRISGKPLPTELVLKLSIQISEALDAAHAKGITHRDLKPANIFITQRDQVKVLDFGLAKLASPVIGELASTQSDKGLTEEGVIMGTVANMSPEQGQGKKVDARSDIFSFGSVLYEMATGQRAFQGETKLAILSAVLDKEPVPVSAIVPKTLPDLEKLIARCLRKDPERRIQHMGDVKLALEELKEESDSGKARAPVPPRRRPWALVGAAGLVLLVLAAAAVTWWLKRAPGTAPFPSLTLTRLTSDAGLTTDPALSSDGKLLAYASDRSGEGHLDIYVRQVGGGEPLRLTRGPGDKREPTFSPDGTTIAFRSEQEGGGIDTVSALGGPARRIVPDGDHPQFSPDGNWLAYSVQLGSCFGTRNLCRIYVVPSTGGEVRQLRSDFAAALYAIWSSDGNHLLFLGEPDEKLPEEKGFDWYVTPLDSGPAIKTEALVATRSANLTAPLSASSSSPRWMVLAPAWQPQGDALVFSARSGDSTNLWRIGISPKTWKVTGPPQRLTSGAAEEQAPSVASGPRGIVRLAFASLTGNLDIWGLPINPNQGKVTGEPKRLTQDTAADFHPALSADSNKMAWVSDRSGSQEIWMRDLRSGEDRMLTASRSGKWHPRFSPDGSRLSFASDGEIYVMPVSGGAPEMVCENCGEATDWSPDGKRLIGDSLEGQVWVFEVASHYKTDLLPHGRRGGVGAFSRDNRWCVFGEFTTGRTYVAPLDEVPIPESAWVPVVDNWWDWEWYGNLIYSVSNRDGFSCIWAQRLDAVTKRPVGAPFPVFHAHNARISLANTGETYLSIDHDKMLFTMAERTGNIWMAEWKEQ